MHHIHSQLFKELILSVSTEIVLCCFIRGPSGYVQGMKSARVERFHLIRYKGNPGIRLIEAIYCEAKSFFYNF